MGHDVYWCLMVEGCGAWIYTQVEEWMERLRKRWTMKLMLAEARFNESLGHATHARHDICGA